jgi:hypothetical protein
MSNRTDAERQRRAPGGVIGLVMIFILGAAVGVLIFGAAFSVWGSRPPTATSEDPSIYPKLVKLPDGRTVTCVIFDPQGEAGALSCDWVAS